MDIWKQLTVSGNLAFKQNHYEEAERHYQQACQRTQQLLWVWFDAEEIITALAIGFQNLAELYFKQSRHHEGLAQYQQLNSLLLSYQAQCSSDGARQAVVSVHRRVGTELLFATQELNLEFDYAKHVLKEFSHPVIK